MTSGVILLARLLSVLLLLRILLTSRVRCQRWDYRFAIDQANDVQPAYLTVLTKTPLLAAPEY